MSYSSPFIGLVGFVKITGSCQRSIVQDSELVLMKRIQTALGPWTTIT